MFETMAFESAVRPLEKWLFGGVESLAERFTGEQA